MTYIDKEKLINKLEELSILPGITGYTVKEMVIHLLKINFFEVDIDEEDIT